MNNAKVAFESLLEGFVASLPRVAANRLLCELEPEIRPLRVREGNVSDVHSAIRSTPNNEFKTFATKKSRSAFLAAALEHLAPIETHEELLVGFGRTAGTRAQLDGLWRGVGGVGAVGPSRTAHTAIERQVTIVDDGEVVLVHNHPPNDLKDLFKAVFGWRPLPSSCDRDYAAAKNMEALMRFLLFRQRGRFRWFLVDEGELAEFYLPSVESCIQVLNGLMKR